MTISNETLIKQLNWRYAVKKFDATKKISPENWKTLEQALILTPSSFGLQPWRFIIVTNPDTRAKLREHSWGQSQVTDSSHHVVFACATKISENDIQEYVDSIAQARGVKSESLKGYKDMMIGTLVTGERRHVIKEWSARQCYIALGNLMTSASFLGIDACPMEGIDPAKYDEILNLEKTGFATVVVCSVGYRASDDNYAHAAKVRFGREKLVVEIA